MARLFLLYVMGDDEPFVERLGADLAAAGHNVWYQLWDAEYEAQHPPRVERAVEAMDFMLLVASPAAFHSPQIQGQWRYARSLRKRVCLLLRGAGPEDLPPELHRFPTRDF